MTLKIAFIGAGQMAGALAAGIFSSSTDVEFVISDPNPEAAVAFQSRIPTAGVLVADSNDQAAAESDVVFLAVKPQYLQTACRDWSAAQQHQPLLISVVAGATIETLKSLTGLNRVVRVMPNTPCLVNRGASAIAVDENSDADDIELASRLLASVGMVQSVTEQQLDAVTGLSGSGPAFVFTFIESLSDGGVLAGLPRKTATELAIQTVIGAATLVRESGEHPSVLRDRVASPGGTTISGIAALEANGLRSAVISAVQAAAVRSKELGE